MAIGSYVTTIQNIIPGQVDWFRARYVNGLGGATPANDAPVTEWTSVAPIIDSLENATGAEQPVFKTDVNGFPGVLYNGTSSRLAGPSGGPSADLFSAGGCVFFVVRVDGLGGTSQGRLFSLSGGNMFFNVSAGASGLAKLNFKATFSTTAGVWVTDGEPIVLGEFAIIAISYDASNVANNPVIYCNSLTPEAITTTTSPVGSVSAAATLTIGNAAASTRTFDGYFFEALFVKNPLDSDIIGDIMRAFANEYKLELS